MKKYKVTIIFTVLSMVGLVGLGSVVSKGSAYMPILVLSFGTIVWALRKVTPTDFINTKECDELEILIRNSTFLSPQFSFSYC